MTLDDYEISIRPLSLEDGGGFLAEVLGLPGCVADGATRQEAMDELQDAFSAWQSAHLADGQSMPLIEHRKRYHAGGAY